MSCTEKLIAEYGADYCLFLEATYGKDMLSEGKEAAIDRMFDNLDLSGKRILDIGSGLGGLAFHLAKTHNIKNIVGLEINPWLVKEARERCPHDITDKVSFEVYKPPKLPFDVNSFDIVCSKGVLTHVQDKAPLFAEIYRVLETGGYLIIDDWLSPVQDQFGKRLQKMCELEDLTLFADTPEHYASLLKASKFRLLTQKNESNNYVRYNQAVIDGLKEQRSKPLFIEKFGQKLWDEALSSYQLIRDSIADGELLIYNFNCQKVNS